jgi:Family of unknown function (DUF6011)
MKDFLDGFENDDLGASKPLATAAELRANAHITNGGEKAMTACIKCGGSGQTRWGPCFRCEGKGRITVRSAAASKAKVTREQNLIERRVQFHADHAAEMAYITKRAGKGSSFYASMAEAVETYGHLTERQLAMVQADIAKDEAFWAAKRAEKAAAAPVVDMSAITALFDTAKGNGVNKLVWRANGLTISPSRELGTSELWVKDTNQGAWVGKIAAGKFQAFRAATDKTLPMLCEIATNPTAAAKEYGRETGNCCVCGRELTDPVSMANKIGPICAEKWGL